MSLNVQLLKLCVRITEYRESRHLSWSHQCNSQNFNKIRRNTYQSHRTFTQKITELPRNNIKKKNSKASTPKKKKHDEKKARAAEIMVTHTHTLLDIKNDARILYSSGVSRNRGKARVSTCTANFSRKNEKTNSTGENVSFQFITKRPRSVAETRFLSSLCSHTVDQTRRVSHHLLDKIGASDLCISCVVISNYENVLV